MLPCPVAVRGLYFVRNWRSNASVVGLGSRLHLRLEGIAMSSVQALNEAEAEAAETGKSVMRCMDPSLGDMKVVWSSDNEDETALARDQFRKAIDKGLTAYGVTRRGKKAEVMREFDPDAEAIIFAPRVVGG